MLEPVAGCGLQPGIFYMNISDENDNPISHSVGAPSSDSFEPIFDRTYDYSVTYPDDSVRVIQVKGVNIGRISANVPFEVSIDV